VYFNLYILTCFASLESRERRRILGVKREEILRMSEKPPYTEYFE
jgi:hypothetical protein